MTASDMVSTRHKTLAAGAAAAANPSVAVGAGEIVFIQLGDELHCALTRGWLAAFGARRRFRVVTRAAHRELLDVSANPAACHVLRPGLLGLLRESRRLRAAGVSAAIALDPTRTSRLLASLSGAAQPIAPAAPGDDPAAVDAALARQFAALGVATPVRDGPLRLTRRTRRYARALLEGLNLDSEHIAVLCAPSSAHDLAGWLGDRAPGSAQMPVVLLPPGRELEVLRTMAGEAYFIRADTLALRAALIGRAGRLISDDESSIAIGRLMRVECERPRGT